MGWGGLFVHQIQDRKLVAALVRVLKRAGIGPGAYWVLQAASFGSLPGVVTGVGHQLERHSPTLLLQCFSIS